MYKLYKDFRYFQVNEWGSRFSHNTNSVFSCNLMVKMARSTSYTSFVVLLISLNYIYPESAQHNYPIGSLACKTYEMTKMDCSYRDLFEVTRLDQNGIIELDLSQNHLINITGEPFEKLHMLLVLDLSYNEISNMSATSLKGLKSLKQLNLQYNYLVDLPSHIFANFNLLLLNLAANGFKTIPGETLASLLSCKVLILTNGNTESHILEIGFSGFQNLTNLHKLAIGA